MRAHSSSVLALVFLVACGGGPPPSTPAASPPETRTTTATPETPPKPAEPPKEEVVVEAPKLEAKPPTVKLLEPGAAPRRALRYKFKAGTTEYAGMDMKLGMSMSMGGKEMPKVDLPMMRTVIRLDAKEVSPDGDLKVTFDTQKVEVVKDAKADPKLVSALEGELQGLVGLKGHATISPRGVARDTDFELPPTASPKLKGQMDSMRDAIRNMYMPLPEEEVGKGAKWEVSSRVPVSGAMMDVVATHTLQSLAADSAQAAIDITLSAPSNQPMQLGNVPGVTATLDSLAGKGTGKSSPSFVKLVGTGTSNVSMQMVSTAALRGEKVSMKVDTNVSVSVGPTKAPTPAAKR